MKVLLVDDDPDLVDVTSYALRREGFNVIVAGTGQQALQRWEADQPDLVVLDVGLPNLNGFEVCRKIRDNSSTPVIFLTGMTQDENVVRGFHLGADDYVPKPFSPKQLAMRIRAVWRRTATPGAGVPKAQLQLGNLLLDVEAHEVYLDGEPVKMTPIEFRLLRVLATNLGRVVSGTQLVDLVWGYDGGGDVSLLKTHISHIRRKISAEDGKAPVSIQAVPGVGYRLTVAQ
jgi:two-component system OmpR family response regulator